MDYLEFEAFSEDVLYHAEEACRFAHFCTLQSQQSQKHRDAEGHTECVYNVED